MVVRTRSLSETQLMLEQAEADFMLTYHHPLLAVRLNARQYSHRTLAQDKLVPLTRCDALGEPAHRWHPTQPGAPLPWLAYASHLALGRLLGDHLANHPQAPPLRRVVDCDSADALLEYTLQGLGIAWLPWSLAGAACRAGQLCVLGSEALSVDFEVRLYRAKRPLSPLAEATWQATQPGR